MSLLGDEVSLIAIPLIAVSALHAGPAEMGLLAAAAGTPTLLFSLHLGAWLERLSRSRSSMVFADAGRALLLASLPAAWLMGVLSGWQLYVVAFASGTLSVVSGVSQPTVFVSLVPRDLYLQANSLLQGGRAMTRAVGSGLGGVLVQTVTAPLAVVLDAASFLASALLLLRIPVGKPNRSTTRPTEVDGLADLGRGGSSCIRQSVACGIAWIARDRVIRGMLAAVATINFFLFAYYALFVLYVTRTLHLPAWGLGLVLAGGAIGGLAGSVLTNPIARRIGIGPAFAAGCIAFPLPLVLVSVVPASAPAATQVAQLVLAQSASGFGLMLLDVIGGTIRAALIPSGLRSRVTAAHLFVNKGVRPLGSLLGGASGTLIGLRSTLLVTTLAATAAVMWVLPCPLLGLPGLPRNLSE